MHEDDRMIYDFSDRLGSSLASVEPLHWYTDNNGKPRAVVIVRASLPDYGPKVGSVFHIPVTKEMMVIDADAWRRIVHMSVGADGKGLVELEGKGMLVHYTHPDAKAQRKAQREAQMSEVRRDG